MCCCTKEREIIVAHAGCTRTYVNANGFVFEASSAGAVYVIFIFCNKLLYFALAGCAEKLYTDMKLKSRKKGYLQNISTLCLYYCVGYHLITYYFLFIKLYHKL